MGRLRGKIGRKETALLRWKAEGVGMYQPSGEIEREPDGDDSNDSGQNPSLPRKRRGTVKQQNRHLDCAPEQREVRISHCL